MQGLWRWSREGERDRGSRELPADGTLRIRPGRHGVVLRAVRGVVQVTQAGDPEDHVLEAGEEVRLPGGGLVVAFALRAARLVVCDALPSPRGQPACRDEGQGVRAA